MNEPEQKKINSRDDSKKIFDIYADLSTIISKDIQNSRTIEIKEMKETIRNFILINGALAAFALPILNNPEIYRTPLTLSIVLFLINILIAYWYLQRSWTNNFLLFRSYEEKILDPVLKMQNLAVKTTKGECSNYELLSKHEEFKKIDYEKIKDEINIISTKSKKLDHTDDLLIILFTLSIILVIYALLGRNLEEMFISSFLFLKDAILANY